MGAGISGLSKTGNSQVCTATGDWHLEVVIPALFAFVREIKEKKPKQQNLSDTNNVFLLILLLQEFWPTQRAAVFRQGGCTAPAHSWQELSQPSSCLQAAFQVLTHPSQQYLTFGINTITK